MDNKQILEKLEELKEQGYVHYEQCPTWINLNDKNSYAELELTDRDEVKIAQLVKNVPALAEMLLNESGGIINLPKGIAGMSIVLTDGIIASEILGQVAALGLSNVFGVFSIFAICTGQFVLLSIIKELKLIDQKLEMILEFLRNEKESNLLSEANFIKYACDNYSLIMPNEPQRVATIANIQQAKKVAMKDIEFYLRDFKNTTIECGAKNIRDWVKAVEGVEKIENNLDFALQLYIMSSLMEVCYAQNYERKYIENLKSYVTEYVADFTKNICRGYGNLENSLKRVPSNTKDLNTYNECKKEINEKVSSIETKYKNMCDKAYEVLEKSTQKAEYYIKKEGSKYRIYYKK